MDNDLVLVIGSKPDCVLPNVTPKKIYVANGAAERAITYKEKNSSTYIISITGSAGLKIKQVRERIKKLRPHELISHNGKIDLENFFDSSWLEKVKFRYIEKKGIEMQKKYFSRVTLRMADLGLVFGSGNILFGIIRLFYAIIIKRKPPMGLTTGCLSILMALSENKSSKILVTGISLHGGNHFYKFEGIFPYYRGWADAYLIKRLPSNLKSRILTNDITFSKVANVKLI
ncbi:hypothetical protein [Candidatus Pelagibacter sp.]|uniref:hypothetical protein n=1 Tax=Candidatus Pelagibacter sp. TaxID=2024849 RepID=UPI003F869FED